MLREERRRGAAGISVYPDNHLGSVLHGKRSRMLEDDSIVSLGEAKQRSKNALRITVYILLFPFFALYWLASALFKRRRLSSKDKKPVASRFVSYYKPQINLDGTAQAFTAPDISGGIEWDDAPHGKRASGLFKRKPKSLLDKVFNKRRMSGSAKAKIAAMITSMLLILTAVGYGGWWYLEGRYSIVSIDDNGVITEVRTSDDTVNDVLLAGGVELDDADILSLHPSTEVRDGLSIGIVRAKGVTVSTKDGEQEVQIAQGTVYDALAKANISYDEDDEISPSLETDISDGLYIRMVDVQVQYETKQESIPFNTVTQDSDSIAKGETDVKAEGANGQKSIKERIVVRDGAEASREVIGTTVDYAPVDRVVLNGTYVEPEPEPLPEPAIQASNSSGGNKTSNNKTSGNNTSSNSSSSSSKPSSSGSSNSGNANVATSGSSMTVDFITAYTHTGKKTSTGVWPTRGMCAVNPNIIPYGTVLDIPGYGTAVAVDTGSFTNGKNAIDVFFETEEECRQWGRKYSVTIQIIK